MFTGIITAKAKVLSQTKVKAGLEVNFARPKGWDDLVLGESIAVNGVCLTVASMTNDTWTALLMPETLSVTAFKDGLPNEVNLERAMPIGERLSGHIVQGHVDGVGEVAKIDKTDGYVISVEFSKDNASLVIYKGSITVNGVSLTVTECTNSSLSVALIPHTLEHTTLGLLKQGSLVNLEFDVIGKYVARFMEVQK